MSRCQLPVARQASSGGCHQSPLVTSQSQTQTTSHSHRQRQTARETDIVTAKVTDKLKKKQITATETDNKLQSHTLTNSQSNRHTQTDHKITVTDTDK